MRRLHSTSLLFLIGCFTVVPTVSAQGSPQAVVVGSRFQLESEILGERRELLIATPPGYNAANGRYGVLYVLDGDIHFEHVAASAGFLSHPVTLRIPELIVVAIANSDRNRDFTPETENADEAARFPTHGGADRFRRFLLEELLPWVDERYRTNGYQALAGHSLSGLFAIHTLVTEPDSFDAYLSISPSLWWNDERVIDEAGDLIHSTPGLSTALYMATGNEPLYENARRLADILEADSPSEFKWALDLKETQSHNSVAPVAFYEGLEVLFDGWDLTDEVFSMFDNSTIEEIATLYRDNGERFGIERTVPVVMLHNFQAHLINSDRLDEAADAMLYEPAAYYLVPELLNQLVEAYVQGDDDGAAADFLRRLVRARPFDARARQALSGLGTDPGPE